MPRIYKIYGDHAAITDPCWEKLSIPVYDFLVTPKNWAELGKMKPKIKGGILRQCLAWLEAKHRVKTFFREGVVYWARSRYVGPQSHHHDAEQTDDA